ncbi:MAG TPA: NfeD family protein [Bacteroidales bacterium]|nr:NfeD family protein [Bacteroidales bacterium]
MTTTGRINTSVLFLLPTALFLMSLLSYFPANGQNETSSDTVLTPEKRETVYVFEIREEIAKPVWRKTQMAFDEAIETKSSLILIHMNTYGGQVDFADSIRTRILQSTIPVYVFIDNNAASAGALISIACDSIYMRPGGNIGAATVVNQSAEQLPDKYQSYMRAMMRSTAETNGRDPQIAQAMVDPDVEVEGISEKGKVLTFTTQEALDNGFCEGIANNYQEVIKNFTPLQNPEIVVQKLTLLDKLIGILISPAISGLLIMVIIGGIYFELQSPGIGFPSIAAATAALIYFAPLYLEGLAAHWEIAIFIVGIILVMVEIFALPGFGVAGISGILLIMLGLSFSMVGNVGFSFSAEQIEILFTSIMVVLIATTTSVVLSFFLTKKILTSKNLHFALNTVLDKNEGFTSSENIQSELIGSTGIARTVLRPGGKIEINQVVYDAVAETTFIEKGTPVVVTRYVNAQLFVKKTNQNRLNTEEKSEH